MKELINRAMIVYWMMLNPVRLFQRINELDWYRNTLRSWVGDLPISANAHILEVGCATGVLTEYLVSRGFHATGIDASDKMIEAALSNNCREAHYQSADARSLPFKESSFDTVISASLLNIVNEPEKVLAQMTRVCKQGGTVSVLVPRLGFSNTQISHLIKSENRSAFSSAVMATWHQRAPKMHSRDLIDLFRQAGLVCMQEQPYLEGMVTTVSGRKN